MRRPGRDRRRGANQGFWLISIVTAVLGAMTAVVSALLQGSLVNPRTVVGVAVSLVVINLLLTWLQGRRMQESEPEEPRPGPRDAQTLYARDDLISQVQSWASNEQERSLTRIADLQLRFALRPEALDPALRWHHDHDHAVERGTRVRDLYERLGHQLLVLGEPGAGKTTQLAELAQSLLVDAGQSLDARVPVVFRLPSWSVAGGPLEEWLADSLVHDYGVSPRLARHWLETEHLVPLLDRFDELAEPRRQACLEAINQFREAHGQLPLVVCSRVQEYEELPDRLRLRGAIVIQPLTSADVDTFVRRRRRELSDLRTALDNDPGLCELLTTPLLLNIAALTYRGKPVPPVRGDSLIERRDQVLAHYVDEMLQTRAGPNVRYPARATVAWLRWLARAMEAHSQPVFYVDRLQADWVPAGRRRRLVSLGATGLGVLLHVGLTVLLAAVALGIALLVDGMTPAATVAALLPRLGPLVLLAALGGGALALAVHDHRIEPIRWSRQAFRQALARSLARGAVVVPLLSVAGAALVQPALRPSAVLLTWAALGLPVGLGVGLWFAIAAGYGPPIDQTPAAPGRDIEDLRRAARMNALVSLLVVGPVVAAVCGLAFWLSIGRASPALMAVMAVAGLFAVSQVALLTYLRLGGMAYLRHRVLRWQLHRAGCAPPDMMDFLAYAARLNLLRRQGGGYEFVHDLLRQHLARAA
jgi:hypothetical protein